MRKTDKLNRLLLLSCLLVFAACSDDPEIVPEEPIQVVDGIYVLNEGGFNQNNASISYYDFVSNTFTANAFLAANASGDALGDVANDAVIYGSKMYVVVNNSNKVEVLDANTLERKSDGIVDINQPRFLVCTEGKVLVSSYDDNVYVLDTADYHIERKIPVGRDPEMMVALNDKIYVANSGGVSEMRDNRIFIIDAQTYAVEGTIIVADNLTGLYAGINNTLYATSMDVYDANWTTILTPAKFMSVDIANRQVSKTFDFQVQQFTSLDGVAYIYSSDYADEPRLMSIDMSTNAIINENITNVAGVGYIYAFGINPSNGDIWVGDSGTGGLGKVLQYSNDGQFKQSFDVGYFPKKFVFKQ